MIEDVVKSSRQRLWIFITEKLKALDGGKENGKFNTNWKWKTFLHLNWMFFLVFPDKQTFSSTFSHTQQKEIFKFCVNKGNFPLKENGKF